LNRIKRNAANDKDAHELSQRELRGAESSGIGRKQQAHGATFA
jgi:hypothetical protein